MVLRRMLTGNHAAAVSPSHSLDLMEKFRRSGPFAGPKLFLLHRVGS